LRAAPQSGHAALPHGGGEKQRADAVNKTEEARTMHPRIVICFVLAMAAAGCASRIMEGPQDVPAALQAPENQKLVLKAHASGVQIYQCTAAGSGQFGWTLIGPEAVLSDRVGARIGRHYAGPTWKASDGSLVVGQVKAHSDSPDDGSIAWLLLDATHNTGTGTLGKVESIQRLHTQSGKAPADGCDAAHAMAEARSPYQADYYFYEPR
jgi:hypothetical protein